MTTLDDRIGHARAELDAIGVRAPTLEQVITHRRRVARSVKASVLSLAVLVAVVGLFNIPTSNDASTRVESGAPAVTDQESPEAPQADVDDPADDPDDALGWPWLLLVPLLPIILLATVFGPVFALPLWALVDAARRSEAAYRRTGQSRTFWLTGISVGIVFGLLPGILLAIVYLVAVRRQLALAEKAAADEPFTPVMPPLDDREPARVRRRRRLLLGFVAALGVGGLLLPPSSPDNGQTACGVPIVFGDRSEACDDAERQQLVSAAALLLAAAIGAYLARRVPPQQRFRGVLLQLTVGLALIAFALTGSFTAEPRWLRWLFVAVAIGLGVFLTARASLLIPARRSTRGMPPHPVIEQ